MTVQSSLSGARRPTPARPQSIRGLARRHVGAFFENVFDGLKLLVHGARAFGIDGAGVSQGAPGGVDSLAARAVAKGEVPRLVADDPPGKSVVIRS